MIEPQVHGDHRGFLMESWRHDAFASAGIDADFVQDNHSRSRQGILRGLHYQIQQTQGKVVRATRGDIYDVAVDLRRSSRTFGQWVGAHLSEESKNMLWVPPGFGHGFYVLSEVAEVLYKCTHYYAPEHERCILWNDPAIAINWPLVNNNQPTLSDKDRCGALLSDAETYP